MSSGSSVAFPLKPTLISHCSFHAVMLHAAYFLTAVAAAVGVVKSIETKSYGCFEYSIFCRIFCMFALQITTTTATAKQASIGKCVLTLKANIYFRLKTRKASSHSFL